MCVVFIVDTYNRLGLCIGPENQLGEEEKVLQMIHIILIQEFENFESLSEQILLGNTDTDEKCLKRCNKRLTLANLAYEKSKNDSS